LGWNWKVLEGQHRGLVQDAPAGLAPSLGNGGNFLLLGSCSFGR
jgi:hypothetical protein